MSFKTGMKSIWEKLKNFWIENMNKYYKKISLAFGLFLINSIWFWVPAIQTWIETGNALMWRGPLSLTVGAFAVFVVLVCGIFFGNSRPNGDEKQ